MKIALLFPRRPDLLRALYKWYLDNKMTPHLVVDVTIEGVIVPIEYIQHRHIILNIARDAIKNIVLGNKIVRFNACFRGVSKYIEIPVAAILAIFSNEKYGNYIIFKSEETNNEEKKMITVIRSSSHDNKKQVLNTLMSVIDNARQNHVDAESKPTVLSYNNRPHLKVVK